MAVGYLFRALQQLHNRSVGEPFASVLIDRLPLVVNLDSLGA